MMRLDPDLCFLDRCGPPDSNDIQEELKMASINDNDENSKLEEDEDRYVKESQNCIIGNEMQVSPSPPCLTGFLFLPSLQPRLKDAL